MDPAAARMWVVVFMDLLQSECGSAVGVDPGTPAGANVGDRGHRRAPIAGQPLGLIMEPSPARMRVVVFIALLQSG